MQLESEYLKSLQEAHVFAFSRLCVYNLIIFAFVGKSMDI